MTKELVRLFARLLALLDRTERRLLGSVRYYRRRGAKIGKVIVFTGPALAEPHLCEIGDNVWITRNCTLLNHDGSPAMLRRAGLTDVVNVVGKIVIRDNVFIGANSTIMPDVEIGPNAIVAAGSVVTHDVPPNTVVGGCPARAICTIEEYLAKINNEEMALWIDSEPEIQAAVTHYFMTAGHRGRKAIRLRCGATPLTE